MPESLNPSNENGEEFEIDFERIDQEEDPGRYNRPIPRLSGSDKIFPRNPAIWSRDEAVRDQKNIPPNADIEG